MVQEILEFDEPLNVCFYHFVCDANVRSGKGNVKNETAKWISELLELDPKPPYDLQSIIVKIRTLDLKVKRLIFQCQFKLINSDNLFYRRKKPLTCDQLFEGGNKDIEIDFGKTIIDFRQNIIKEMTSVLKLKNKGIILENEDIAYEGGTHGHAIAFYFSKNQLVICNSGDGISDQEIHLQKEGEDGIKKFETIATFNFIDKWYLLATLIFCSEFDLSVKKTKDDLYPLLYSQIQKTDTMGYFFEGQISGSCTFWSMFYLLLYKSKWPKLKLETYLLKLAGNYFIKNQSLVQDKIGFDALVAAVDTKFKLHSIELPTHFAENIYQRTLDKRSNQFINNLTPLEKLSNKKYTVTSLPQNIASSSFLTETSINVLVEMEYIGLSGRDLLASSLSFYYCVLRIIDKTFLEIEVPQDNRLIMIDWMNFFYRLKNDIAFELRAYPNQINHLKQLIICVLLVLNEYSTEKLWVKSNIAYEHFSSYVTKYLFACSIKDSRFKKYESILSSYHHFWDALFGERDLFLEQSSNIDFKKAYTHVVVDDITEKTKIIHEDDFLKIYNSNLKQLNNKPSQYDETIDIPVYIYAWIFPYIAFGNFTIMSAENDLSRLYFVIQEILTYTALQDGNIIIQTDQKKFKYKMNYFIRNASMKTNEFFDFNHLIVDRIIADNYTEKEIIQNLPIQRILIPPNGDVPLITPLHINQFSDDHDIKKEFDSIQAIEKLSKVPILSIKLLAYLATLFYIADHSKIPKFITTNQLLKDQKQDIFFVKYIEILESKQVSAMDIFDMISNDNYYETFNEIDREKDNFEYLFVSIALTKIPSNESNLFFNQLEIVYNQIIKIKKIKETYPLKKLQVNSNNELVLDGKLVYEFHTLKDSEAKKEDYRFNDKLSQISFYWNERIHFYSKSDSYSEDNPVLTLTFLKQHLLGGKKFELTMEKNNQLLLFESKKYIRQEINEDGFYWNSTMFNNTNLRFTNIEKGKQEDLIFFTSEHFAIRNIQDSYRLLTTTKEYEIITSKKLACQRFIAFPESCILYSENSYYLFLRHLYDYEKKSYDSPWATAKPLSRRDLKLAHKTHYLGNETHCIISIASNSSHLHFQDSLQALCYLKLCIYYQEIDGLLLHFNQLYYLIQTASQEINENFRLFLEYFEGSFNNPFSHYFQYIWNANKRFEPNNIPIYDFDYTSTKDKEWPSINPNAILMNESFDAKEKITLYSFWSIEFFKRKSKYPPPFQLLKVTTITQKEDIKEFSNQQLELLKRYVALLEQNVFEIVKRPIITTATKRDNSIELWSKTLDGKQICQLHSESQSQEVKNYILKTKKIIELQTENLEYELTSFIIKYFKIELMSSILQRSSSMVIVSLINRILLNALESMKTITSCQPINKYVNYLKEDIIFTDKRPSYYLYLEYMSGYFIRKDQHAFIENLTQNQEEYIVLRELLMGLGKTTVILPLLASKLSLVRKIFVVVPSHMQKESSLNLASNVELFSFPLTPSSRENPMKNVHELLNNDFQINIIDDNELKRIQLNRLVWSNKLDIYTNNELTNILSNSNLIIDEFDSLYNPATSVLQYPIGDLSINATGINLKEWKDILRYIFKRKVKNEAQTQLLIASKLQNAFLISKTLVLNLNYGFSKIDSNRLTAVPYMYVNKPIEGSSFSYILLQFLMTFILHYQLNNNKIYEFHLSGILNFFNEWIFRRNVKDPITIKRILKKLSLENLFTVQDLFQLKYIDDKLLFLKTKIVNLPSNFNYKFVKTIVLPEMGDTDFIVSTSFLEAVYHHPFNRVYAFSGTTNIILPNEIKQKEEIINRGAIHYAITFYEESTRWNSKLTNIQNVTSLVKTNGLDAFMDAGAFLLGENLEEFAITLSLETQRDVLFFNSEERLLTNGKTVIPYQYSSLPLKTIILYDQANCIGVNIVQYLPMIGFVTIDPKQSQYEFVSQAIFRLRSINHGHSIHLVTKDSKMKTTDLLDQLHENGNKYVNETQEPFRLLQTMFYKSDLPLLKPKFSEIIYGDSYLNYLKSVPILIQTKEFQSYLQLTEDKKLNLRLECNTSKEKSKEKSKEQENQNEAQDTNSTANCQISEALKKSNLDQDYKGSEFLEILKIWHIYIDYENFDIFQFAAIVYPWVRSTFFYDNFMKKRNFYHKKKLEAPIPFYYHKKNNGYELTNYENATNHTDEKDAPVILKFLCGSFLSEKQQFELDIDFITNKKLKDVIKIIKCFNGERIASIGDLKRIYQLFDDYGREPTKYKKDLSENHKLAEEYGFYNSELFSTKK